ncbi:hypothetical protein PAXINDRAFT_89486, partial [Paxillus involutus ATCC 200175]
LPAGDATSCNYRSIWSVLGSCALMFIISTWNTIHPPVVFHQRWYIAAARQAHFVYLALLIPELLIGTVSLSYIQTDNRPDERRNASDYQWTRTHGFFALMGGFVLQDGTRRTVLRTRGDLHRLKDKRIINPTITKSEIKDKSKADGLVKALLILQLSWFIIQVSARGANHLAITLLEIDTLAMAAMNFPVLFFWWDKPMAPQYPHTFYLNTLVLPDGDGDEALLNEVRVSISVTSDNILHRQEPREYHFWANPMILYLWKWWERFTQFDGLDNMYGGSALSISWMIFGALHLVAWDFQFPSRAEKITWRVASLALVIGGFMSGQSVVEILEVEDRPIFLVYAFLARMMILALMLASLRDLPASAYETVPWTTYIPHL